MNEAESLCLCLMCSHIKNLMAIWEWGSHKVTETIISHLIHEVWRHSSVEEYLPTIGPDRPGFDAQHCQKEKLFPSSF